MPIWLRRFTVVFCCLFAFWGLKILAHAGPTLRLSKTGTASVSSGGTISYALTFENGFDETARDVTIDDTLPPGTYFLSASDGGTLAGDRVTFRLGSVGAQGSKTVTVRVQVPFDVKAGSEIKSGSATVLCSLGSAASGNVKTTVSASRSAAATGKIVFSTRRAPATERQIYSINPDGSGLTQLTNDNGMVHSEVALSADGSKIAFLGATRSTANPLILNPPHLYVMNAQPQSATNQPIQITNETAGIEPDAGSTIGWNPNGIQVVYTSSSSFHLIADLKPQTANHGAIFLSVFGGSDFNFSPNGKSLVFTRNTSSTDNEIETLKLDTDASGRVLGSSDKEVVLLTDGFQKFLPAFNPDGSKIAFVQKASASGDRNSDLYVVDVASKALTRLTTNQNVFESGLGSTSWSPDGTLITFGSDGPGRKPDGTLTTHGIDGVYTLKPAPASDQNGDNFPQYISEGNTSYYPHFAQVSLPTNTTSLSGNLRKTATASADPFGTSITTIPQGGTFFYHIFWSLKNGTSSAISTATIQDQIPAGTTYVAGGDATQFDSNGGQFVVFNLGSIAAGATVSGNSTFSVKVAASAKVDDVILNPGGRYFALSNGVKLFGDNPVSLKVTAGAPGPVLSLSKSVISIGGDTSNTTGTVLPGDSIRYLLKFSNTGTGAATNVQIIDPIPLNTRASSVDFTDSKGAHIDAPAGYTANLTSADGTVTFKVPSFAAGATGYAGLTVLINNDAASKASQISNVNYHLTADGNIDIKNLPAISNPLRAPLSISKKLALVNAVAYNGTDKVQPGNLLTYEIKVSNPSGNGAVAASNLTLTDFIPLGTTFKNVATGGTFNANNPPFVSYAISSLAVGESKTLQFSVTVDAGTTSSIVNRDYGVQIQGINKRFTGAAVTTPVFVAASLSVAKTVSVIETGSTTQVARGQNLRAVFTVTNTGGSPLGDVALQVLVGGNTFYTKGFLGTPNAPVTGAAPMVVSDANGIPLSVTFKFGTLAAGASAKATIESQVKFRISAKTAGVASGNASGTASTGKVTASDAPIFLTIGGTEPPAPQPSIKISGTVDGRLVTKLSPGDRLTLSYLYKNDFQSAGSGAALRSAFIVGILPSIPTSSGFATPEVVSSSAPYTKADGAVTWKIGDLAPGTSGTLSLVVTIPAAVKVGQRIQFGGNFGAGNYDSFVAGQLFFDLVAAQKIDLRLALSGSADEKQPRTPDGRLKPPATITYQILGSNIGDGQASGLFLRVPIPAGTTYIANSEKISKTLGTIHSGGFGTEPDQAGRIVAIRFIPGESFEKNDSFAVSFAVRLNTDAPQSLTEIKNAATLSAFAPDGSKQTATSNTDTQRVFIPAPSPARLALELNRSQSGGAAGAPFSTVFIITNQGGTTAHNVVLRYSFRPESEVFLSATDGGKLIFVSELPRTIIWDGAGTSEAAKFANLQPGEMISVTLTSKPKNDKALRFLASDSAEVFEKNIVGPGEQIKNPITRNVPPNYIVMQSSAATRSSSGVRSAAGTPNVFSAIGDFFNYIGAAVGTALFGGNSSNPALNKKLQNFDPSASRVRSNAGEDALTLTLKSGRTVTIVPLQIGTSYRIIGPVGVVSNDGGSVISNDGGSLVASGGGNFQIKTDVGLRSISQIFGALISQDGGGLRGSLELYNGGSGKLISQDGGGLISQDGGGLIPFSSLISQDGGGIVSHDASGLLAKSSLISQDGGGFKLTVGASLISQDGGGLVASGGGNLVASGGGNLVASGGGNIYNFQGGDLHAQMSAALVASGGGN